MASYFGTYLLGPLVKEALASTGITTTTGHQLQDTLGNAQRTLRTAEETASQIRSLLDNPGGGLSGQPTIPRGDYTQVCSSNTNLLLSIPRLVGWGNLHCKKTASGACGILLENLPE